MRDPLCVVEKTTTPLSGVSICWALRETAGYQTWSVSWSNGVGCYKLGEDCLTLSQPHSAESTGPLHVALAVLYPFCVVMVTYFHARCHLGCGLCIIGRWCGSLSCLSPPVCAVLRTTHRKYWFWFDEMTCALKYYRNQETYAESVNEPIGWVVSCRSAHASR